MGSLPGAESQPAEVDAIELAIVSLRSLGRGGHDSDQGDRACTILYRAALTVAIPLARRLGLDDHQLCNAIHPRLASFLTRDIHQLVPPTRRAFEAWTYVVCFNALRNELRGARRHSVRQTELSTELASRSSPWIDDSETGLWLQLLDILGRADFETTGRDGRCIADWLRELRTPESDIAMMKILGYLTAEIAPQVRMSTQAVDTRWNRMRTRLDQVCPEHR